MRDKINPQPSAGGLWLHDSKLAEVPTACPAQHIPPTTNEHAQGGTMRVQAKVETVRGTQ